jgi:hypothetical protein
MPLKSDPQAVRVVLSGDPCRTHFIVNWRNLVRMKQKKIFLSTTCLRQLIFLIDQEQSIATTAVLYKSEFEKFLLCERVLKSVTTCQNETSR